MKASRDDLGNPDEPGVYLFQNMRVRVEEKHLKVWQEHPHAVFELIPFQPLAGPLVYALGSWEDNGHESEG